MPTAEYYTWISKKHCPVVRNLVDDEVAHVDYEIHNPVVRNLENVDVAHVDLR